MSEQTVRVKVGTLAQQCDAEGQLSANIRPFPFAVERELPVVKAGVAPNGGRPYRWFVVRVYSAHAFVTERDLVKE